MTAVSRPPNRATGTPSRVRRNVAAKRKHVTLLAPTPMPSPSPTQQTIAKPLIIERYYHHTPKPTPTMRPTPAPRITRSPLPSPEPLDISVASAEPTWIPAPAGPDIARLDATLTVTSNTNRLTYATYIGLPPPSHSRSMPDPILYCPQFKAEAMQNEHLGIDLYPAKGTFNISIRGPWVAGPASLRGRAESLSKRN